MARSNVNVSARQSRAATRRDGRQSRPTNDETVVAPIRRVLGDLPGEGFRRVGGTLHVKWRRSMPSAFMASCARTGCRPSADRWRRERTIDMTAKGPSRAATSEELGRLQIPLRQRQAAACDVCAGLPPPRRNALRGDAGRPQRPHRTRRHAGRSPVRGRRNAGTPARRVTGPTLADARLGQRVSQAHRLPVKGARTRGKTQPDASHARS